MIFRGVILLVRLSDTALFAILEHGPYAADYESKSVNLNLVESARQSFHFQKNRRDLNNEYFFYHLQIPTFYFKQKIAENTVKFEILICLTFFVSPKMGKFVFDLVKVKTFIWSVSSLLASKEIKE